MKPELLSPVGSEESLYAAVRSGADAVYMGYGKYNARNSAQNFGDDAFAAAVMYCHVRGVKVFLTLNTLLSDSEIKDALGTAEKACNAGVDGIIVQDLGLAKLLHAACPDMPLHASTQMTVTSPSAMAELKKLGFVRVVLAREMSKSEIADACSQAHSLGIETEVFVHGALCMCVSGQCYMSAVIGRRSGNRGMCAQPCRLPAQDGTYPLSLKDLSLISYVKELTDIGVDSFKIEGRMKRPEYIAAATASFRQMIDRNFVDNEIIDGLNNVFSRSGHTDGYFTEKIGGQMFGYRTESDVAASSNVLSGLRGIYRSERQSVAVNITFTARANEKMRMTFSDGENTVSADGAIPEKALNRAADAEYVRTQCEKLGGTPYYCNKFTCEIDDGLAIPASAINALRRECAELMNCIRLPKKVAFKLVETSKKQIKKYDKTALIARFSNIDRVPDDLNGLERVFVPADSGEDKLRELIERAENTEIGIELPRALFSLEPACEKWMKTASELGIKWAMCHNIAAVNLASQCGMKIHGGIGLNVFNSYSAAAVHDMGAEYITLSFEPTAGKLHNIAGENLGIFAYGRLPLMLTRNCPASGKKGACGTCSRNRVIIDRMGERFPIECRYSMSEVLNSKILWLADKREHISGYRFALLNFTDETKERAQYVISAYAGGDAPHGEFTRGLYDRGVL